MIHIKIKEKMKEHNFTIAKLAAESGVHRNTISNLINGKNKGIDFDTLDKFCTTFNCNTIDLIEHIPHKK